MRPVLAVTAVGMVVGLAATGCRSPIRALSLDDGVRTIFTHLYALNQRERKLPVDESDMHTRVTCLRDNPDTPRSGPGDDWVCNIVWRTPQATSAGATYSVTVRPDGCFTADGDGPADLVGSQTLVDAEGATVLNPLWAFDGCLPLQ
jgi:ABC-2 type transport system permease protein